jgi:hypothetical protein
MTQRKPAGVSWESWVDGLINQARDRGDFDNLPGSGKPIASLEHSTDELWWVRQLLKREGISVIAPSLALRKAVEDILERVPTMKSEGQVRETLTEINTRIREANRVPLDGPPSSLMPLDIERVVQSWREAQPQH